MTLSLAYIVRPGESNPELRYSLRSIWAHMPHARVWIVGHCPAWLTGVQILPTEQQRSKRENAMVNLAALAARGPEEFVLMNDDFFAMRPVSSPPSPVHRGRLASLADDREAARPGSEHGKVLRLTDSLLREAGIGDPLAYETHTPMHLQRDGLALALDYGAKHSLGEQFAPRSIYGNLLRLGGQQIGNVKVYADEDDPPSAVDWLSTTDRAFRYHPVGNRIRRAFPDPSPYEVA